MTEDQMNPDICSSALEEDGTLDRSKWDGAHKWDDEITYNKHGEAEWVCNECGATKAPPFKCPLCSSDEVKYVEHNGTHLYVCIPCPFMGVEFVQDIDAENLLDYVKRS